MAEQSQPASTPDGVEQLTPLLASVPPRFTIYFVLTRCLRRLELVFDDCWPRKPSNQLCQAYWRVAATEPREFANLHPAASTVTRIEATARTGWDDAYLHIPEDELVERFCSMAALADACDEHPGAEPLGALVRASLSAELFTFLTFHDACANDAEQRGVSPKAVQIRKSSMAIIQRLPPAFSKLSNHPGRHLGAFWQQLPLHNWRDGHFASALTAAIVRDAERLAQHSREHQLPPLDADLKMTRVTSRDVSALRSDLWPQGMPTDWPKPPKASPVRGAPRETNKSPFLWSDFLKRLPARCVALGFLAILAGLCVKVLISTSSLERARAALDSTGIPHDKARIAAGIALMITLAVGIGVWLNRRLAALVQDFAVGLVAALVVWAVFAGPDNGITRWSDAAEVLSAPGSWNPQRWLQSNPSDPQAAARDLLRYPLLIGVSVGCLLMAIGYVLRAVLAAVFREFQRIRRVLTQHDASFRRRLSRRFKIGLAIIGVSGAIVAFAVADRSGVFGGDGVLATRHGLRWTLSYAFPLSLLIGLAVTAMTAVELLAGKVLFGVQSGDLQDRLRTGLMFGPLMAIALLPLVLVPTVFLHRMSYLQLTTMLPGGAPRMIRSMEPRLVPADSLPLVSDIALDRKVFAYDSSHVDLLADRGLDISPTREEWSGPQVPELTVIRVLRVARHENVGRVETVVGLWPEQQVCGTLTMEVPWPDYLHTEPHWESQEYWERKCASRLIAQWLLAQTTQPVPEPVRQWSDNSGQFSTSARLLEVNGDSVVLEKENGEHKVVEMSRLSQDDRDYVEKKKSDLGKMERP